MKYLKLFESFDRYEFGLYQYDNYVVLSYITENAIKFEISELDIIKQTIVYPIIMRGSACTFSTDFLYVIHNLGDYCYSLTIISGFDVNKETIELIDGFDELLSRLVEL